MENNEKKEGEVKEVATPKKTVAKAKPVSVEKPKFTLKNAAGKDVPANDYFYKGIIPSGFEGTCGKPVDREDLLTVFNKVFRPEDNILFYKQQDKEVYLVIVPLKYSDSVGDEHDSIDGDFQKHAISFLTEGSVNVDSLRQKLDKIKKFVKFNDR